MRKVNSPKKIKAMEKSEQGEGVLHSLQAGGGDAVKGARKLHLQHAGLARAEAKAKRVMKPAKGKKR